MKEWFQLKKPRVMGKQFTVIGMTPDELFKKAGYTKRTGDWVGPLDETHRFHAFLVGENRIELHTDLFKPKGKTIYHVASVYKGREEKRRLISFMPLIAKRQRQTRGTHTLSREAYLKAMEDLRNLNRI